MILPSLIGITGPAGSGKDTLAEYLVKKYDFFRYGLADPIKQLLNARFGWTPGHWNNRHWKEFNNSANGTPVGGFIGNESFSPRSWAQWLGTEVGRNTFGENCWVDVFRKWYHEQNNALAREIGYGLDSVRVVVPDIRFSNEAQAIRDLGGTIIQLNRSSIPSVASHSSEAGISGSLVNVFIENNGSISDLHSNFDHWLRSGLR